MRTDVKIGIIVAGVVAVIFVVWLVINATSEPGDGEGVPPQPELAGGPGEGETNLLETERDVLPPPAPPADTTDITPPTPPTPPLDTTDVTPPTPPADVIEPGYAERGTTPPPAPPADTTDVTPPTPPAPPADTRGESDLASRDTTAERRTPAPAPWWSGDDTTGRTTTPLPPLTAETEQTYKVKKGDSYWKIAQAKYGDASLYKVIQDANPNIPPRRLMPGTTIRIPPKPVTVATGGPTTGGPSAPSAPSAAAGETGTDPDTGRRYYVVRSGDKGFWSVSKAVYGHGKHYKLIAEANRDLDPKRLQPGQKVWAPVRMPEATDLAGAPPTTTEEGPTAVSAAGAEVRVETGAPARAVLPDGRVFD